MISPCVQILRHITTKLNSLLGTYQGKTHSTPDLRADIAVLMDNLADNNVYMFTEGRTLSCNNPETKDTVDIGMEGLSMALADFNHAFEARRLRSKQTPITGVALTPSQSNNAQAVNTSQLRDTTSPSSFGSRTPEVPVAPPFVPDLSHPATSSSTPAMTMIEEARVDDNDSGSSEGEDDSNDEVEEEEEGFKCSTRQDVALDSDVDVDYEDENGEEGVNSDSDGDIE
jgi:hypothetical protein